MLKSARNSKFFFNFKKGKMNAERENRIEWREARETYRSIFFWSPSWRYLAA
jgi:hypothetical protein